MIKLLIDNQYITELIKQLTTATTNIFAFIYYAHLHENRKSDNVKEIADILISKHKQGIAIKILFNRTRGKSFITVNNTHFANYISKVGIETKFTDTSRVTHTKAFIIDDDKCFIGSHNLSITSLHRNRETTLFIIDKEINKQLTDYFLKEYHKARE